MISGPPDAPVVLVVASTGTTVSVSTTLPGPTTTGPGAVITINGGPNATANIVGGARTDPADFFGPGVALVVIVVAVFVTRFLFRRKRGAPPAEEAR